MKKKGFEVFETILITVIKCFKWIVLAAVVLLALSGIYKVESGECAVVLRFGRLVGASYEQQVKQPGLHFAFPTIIDEVIKIPVDKVQELEVTTHYGNTSAIDPDVTLNGYIVTGDSNIALIDVKLKYRINDPVSYALYTKDVDGMLRGLVSGELNLLVSQMDIDSVLTSGKTQLAEELLSRAQTCADELSCGVTLTNIEFIDITPPGETKVYFDAVNSAAVGKQTLIQEANDYKAQTLLAAESEANMLINKSEVNQSYLLTVANEEMAAFEGLYAEYIKNPSVVTEGVFRERVSGVLAKMGATIIIPEGSGSPLVVLP